MHSHGSSAKSVIESINKIEELFIDNLIPKNHYYQYALDFDYAIKQQKLLEYINSADFISSQKQWADLVPVHYLTSVPDHISQFSKDEVSICILQDGNRLPYSFTVYFEADTPGMRKLLHLDLQAEAKQCAIIKNNKCFYVDHLEKIAQQINDIQNAILSRKISLDKIADRICEFNQMWDNLIPMIYTIDVKKQSGNLSVQEKFETEIGMLTIGSDYRSWDEVNMDNYPIAKNVTEIVIGPVMPMEISENDNSGITALLNNSLFKTAQSAKEGFESNLIAKVKSYF